MSVAPRSAPNQEHLQQTWSSWFVDRNTHPHGVILGSNEIVHAKVLYVKYYF